MTNYKWIDEINWSQEVLTAEFAIWLTEEKEEAA